MKLFKVRSEEQRHFRNITDANELRDWSIYADFAQVLIAIARPLYANDQILQILSLTLFEKQPILQVFPASDEEANTIQNANQLILFEI